MISEETAQSLIAGFQSIGDATKDMCEAVERLTRAMVENIVCSQIDKCIKYAKRYVNGTFILRWLWKRKLDKEFDRLTRMIDEYGTILAETDIVEKLCEKK